ncbi:hypothetical protein MRX96_047004 [Rhipicephalus microplus]
MHTDTKDPEAESTKFSLAPKSQGLPKGLFARQPAAHAPSEDVNKDNSSISAQKQSSADSLSLKVQTETKDVETGINKFSLVPKSQGLTSGRVAQPSTSRAPSNDANKENISGSAQQESSPSSSSLTVHEETKSPKAGVSILSVVPKSQGLPSGLVVRPPTARAPFKDVSKENSSVSTQKQWSAHYSSVGKHTETKDSEADRTRFSSVPKGQGLPSGLVVRPPTGRAPFKDVSKQNSSVLAQKQSSADSSSPIVHTETNDPKADRTKISLVPKSQGLSSILVTPAPNAGAPFMNANKENPSASAQHESYTRESSPTVHSERKSPEPGSTECSSMSTSSASFGQSGVLPEHPSSTIYSSLMVHKEARDAEAGSTKFSSVPKSQRLPSGLAVRPPIARSPSKDANKESISGSAQHHSSINYSSPMVHKETISTEAGTTKFSSVPKSQGLPSGLVVRPPTARAPCEDVNKESSSVSAQKQLSADYSSVRKHTETEDLEADRTWFSSVPKDQGLPSGLVVRPPTGRAPFKDVSKQNSSVLAQKQSSADSSSPIVHTETNDPKADRTKISLVPKSQGLSSILVTPAPNAGAPFMNANKENPSASAQHESYTRESSPTVHSERKSPEPGSTECSSMSTSSASFGQSGVSAERAALREQARKARALRVRGLGGGDPGECPHLLSPVKEDKLARRVQDALGDVNVALWLFANHRDHLYGLAGNKVAQQTRAPPPIGKPVNGRSSTSSMRNDNAMDPGGTRSCSSNRSSSLITEKHHSHRTSSSGCHVSSGGSTHPASQSGTRNKQQSSAYGLSSSHLSRHDSSRHSQNDHLRQQQPHPPQSHMVGQCKPSTAYSSSATGSKNSRHSAQPLQGSWLEPHQSRGSSSKQGLLGNATSNPKKRPLPSSSAASSAASTTNSPVPSSSQEPRNDLGVRPPAKRARRL